MPMIRFDDNPLITPADVKPSRPDFEVVCVFNAGVIRLGGEILLLLRVAERPRPQPGE
ncbi:MAG TPA: glycosidase, partial [Phycisphaerae bacterium]|nr:glycosidase [Phycisphaerae bacterium]